MSARHKQNGPASPLLVKVQPSTERTPVCEAWRGWYAAHGPALLLYARQQARRPADAEDIVQEAFVRTWRAVARQPAADPRALLFLNIRRSAIDLGRSESSRSARQHSWHESGPEPVALFERTLETEERRAQVESALARLPAEQREVVTLRVWAGLTFDAIAQLTGTPPATTASRYRYALSALEQHLEELRHA